MKRWLLLLLIIAASVAFVVVPVFLIQPFRPQTEGALATGYEVRRVAPWATLALVAAGGWLVWRMWRASSRWWARALMVLLLLPVPACAWAARQNVYELMFNPFEAPAYARPEEAAEYVGDGDMVLAVERGGERVAYPVRLMAYHHLVADSVGGVPVVATY
jgi:thiol:disulfide interchange protein